MMRAIRTIFVLLLTTAIPSLARAQSVTSELLSTVRVAGVCSFTAASVTLAFGKYDPVYTNKSLPLDATAAIGVRCSLAQTARVLLGQGLHRLAGSTDAAPARSVVSGVSNMRYDLYQDAARSVVWGNTTSTGCLYVGTGLYDSVTVYGRVPEAQTPRQGNHTDTVVVTFAM